MPLSTEHLAEQLLIQTLNLTAAVRDMDEEAMRSLVEERDKTILALEALELDEASSTLLARALKAEDELSAALWDQRDRLLAILARDAKEQQAIKAYRTAA